MATQSAEMSSAYQTAPEIELHSIQRDISSAPRDAEGEDDLSQLTRTNVLKVLAASLSFFFAGSNDGSLGALTPYILRTYHVGTEYVALMYVHSVLTWIF